MKHNLGQLTLKTLLACCLLALPATVRGQLSFTTNNGAITITGYTGNPTVIIIPSTTNGYPVTSIGSDALFHCTSLTTLSIGGGVTNIGSDALEYCTSLINITVAANNPAYSSVGGVLFDVSQADLIQFPGGRSGSYSIPNTVTSIGSDAFYYCFSLTSVTIPNSVTNIGSTAFLDCTSLANLSIGNGVTSIGNGAFEDCSSLTSVAIPNSVTNIGNDAFGGASLTSVTISSNVTSIGTGAFGGCIRLTNITVAANNPVYRSMSGVLYDVSQANLIQFPEGLGGSYSIPNTVTNIVSSAFAYCNLTSVSIPGTATSIGSYAFSICTNLTTLSIGNGVTSIGYAAFDQCTKLTSVTIPNSVTSIGIGAFSGCASLTNLSIGSGVTSIGSDAFYDCTSLSGIYFHGNSPTSTNDSTVFSDNEISDPVTVYYLPGTTGWGSTFDGVPTAPWTLPYPITLNQNPGFGVQPGGFGFTISWATNLSVVVEATTNINRPVWLPVQTNALNNGVANFIDPQWTNSPERFYRIRSQ